MVTYNNEDLISKSIKNLVDSIPKDLDYIFYIIDNNSSDSTAEIIKREAQKINQIVFLKSEKNVGFGKGHNKAINIIKSKYHVVLNPDIFIKDKKQIKKMFFFMEENKDVGLLSPLILNEDLTIQYLCKKNPTVLDMFLRRFFPNVFQDKQNKYIMKETGYKKIMPLEYATGCFMFFRSSILKEINGFDEKFFLYLEDADITRKTNEISKTVFFPNAEVIHKWERGAYKNIKLFYYTINSMVIYFNKWGWKFF